MGKDFLTEKMTGSVFFMALPEFRRPLHESLATQSASFPKAQKIQ
jgi:hypothetical protein